jgi:hypothetical protein
MCVDTFDKRNLQSLNKVLKELSCVDQLRLFSVSFEFKSLNKASSRGKPTADTLISCEPKLTGRLILGVKMHLEANMCLRELMLVDLTLGTSSWASLAKGLQSALSLKVLRLNCCKLTPPSKA